MRYRLKDLLVGTSLVSFTLWVLILSVVPLGMFYGLLYIAIAIVIGWSAVKHRNKGWFAALLFAILLLSIPAWVFGSFWLCQKIGFFEP
jgi:hypothetical protein